MKLQPWHPSDRFGIQHLDRFARWNFHDFNTSEPSEKLFVLITSLQTRHRGFGLDWANVSKFGTADVQISTALDKWSFNKWILEQSTCGKAQGWGDAQVRKWQFSDLFLMGWAFDFNLDGPDTKNPQRAMRWANSSSWKCQTLEVSAGEIRLIHYHVKLGLAVHAVSGRSGRWVFDNLSLPNLNTRGLEKLTSSSFDTLLLLKRIRIYDSDAKPRQLRTWRVSKRVGS